MENSSTAAPNQQPSTGFSIDVSSIDLAKIFSACLHCIERATECLREQDHPDALQFSLLRLRMSRLGEAHHLYQEPIPNLLNRADDVAAAKEYLSQLLSLLDVDGSESDGLSGNEKSTSSSEFSPAMWTLLLDTLDSISRGRCTPIKDPPPCQRLREYQGHVSWTTTQYKTAAEIVRKLESKLGTDELRALSSSEQKEIQDKTFDLPTYQSLHIAAQIMDPRVASWVRPVVGEEMNPVFCRADTSTSHQVNIGLESYSFMVSSAGTKENIRKRDRIRGLFSNAEIHTSNLNVIGRDPKSNP